MRSPSCLARRQVTKSNADWGNNMQNLAEFSTVEDFWKVYNNIPKPSQVGHCYGFSSAERSMNAVRV